MSQVFLSYRHENYDHCHRVRVFALQLRNAGISVTLDALMNEEVWNMGGPNEGWLKWSYTQVQDNERVLIIATPSYSQVYEGKAPAGVGVGAAIEANRIFLQIAHDKGASKRFRVVILNAGDEIGLPDQIKDFHQFKPNERSEDFRHLITWIKGSVGGLTTTLPSLAAEPSVPSFPTSTVSVDRRGFVDCDSAFKSFEKMLTAGSDLRNLLVQGPGNHGKSTLLNNLYLHARKLLGSRVAARIEFKKAGSTPEDYLHLIARSLGVPNPNSGNINERLDVVLDACQHRPVIIFFDAYEHAEIHHQHWVNRVLERGLDDEHLRCVLAGRSIPVAHSQPWGYLSVTAECDALKDKKAMIAHAIASGYTGNPQEIEAIISSFASLQKTYSQISPKDLLDYLKSICQNGGVLV